MQTVKTLDTLREQLAAWRRAGEKIAFVPTMGNLHAGHLSLVATARERGDRVVCSIFVNPTQFGPGEDFADYPRTEAADCRQLEDAGADLVFLPDVETMYPGGTDNATFVEVPALSGDLCGEFRPGHFRGVATVVARLFCMVQPDIAVFGEKDFQQLLVIRRMVRDLAMPVEVVGAATLREPDGLAMSSRNQYLSQQQRAVAGRLYRQLQQVAAGLQAGGSPAELEKQGLQQLQQQGFEPDYLAVRRASDLAPAGPEDHELVVLVAARLGRARLIDNLRVSI